MAFLSPRQHSKPIAILGDDKVPIMQSLTVDTLLQMGSRIALVVLCSTAASYLHLRASLETSMKDQLEKYVGERGQRENELFQLAADNQQLLAKEVSQQLGQRDQQTVQQELNQLIEPWKDGTQRNALINQDPKKLDSYKYPSIFIGPNTQLTPDLGERITLSYQLLKSYGPAWRDRFVNTYITLPENVIVNYYAGSAWSLEIPSTMNLPQENWVYYADAKHNPERKTVWNLPVEDPVIHDWLLTCSTPVYSANHQLLMIVQNDVSMTRFLNRTIEDHIKGTHNLVLRTDGKLIAHPQLMAQIQKSGGDFDINQTGDAHLQRILRIVQSIPQSSQRATVIDNSTDQEFLAIAKLQNADWYFLTVYPKSLLDEPAQENAKFILLIGGLALAVEVGLLAYVMHCKVAHPLKKLLSATEKITIGQFDTVLEVERQDELGVLAGAFNSMANQLQSAFAKLKSTNEELEIRVEERTAELKQAKAIADSANQAKSDFLANMSHELRTPLNGVLGYAQILSRSSLNAQQNRGVEIIHQCGSHLLTLINDILDLSKIEAHKLELSAKPFHLPSFLQGVVEICRIRADQKGIDFHYHPPDNLPTAIEADEKRLRQVLINLLGNAIKFTDQGSVTLKVEVVGVAESADEFVGNGAATTHKFPPPITSLDVVHVETALSQLHFQVIDTGVGMTSEQIDKIFQPFEQVGDRNKQTEGTGLGLAISQRIVEMMGSQIQVQSQLNQGSVFDFTIACLFSVDWIQSQTTTLSGKIIGYTGDRRQILVVDDRWENRSVLMNLLEPLGFTMSEADHGCTGLEKAEYSQPDLIITDLAMPIMDGWQFLAELRRSNTLKSTPVIVSSASVYDFDRQKSLDAGGNDFLPKPIQADDLYETLAKHLQLTWIYAETTSETPAFFLAESDLVIPSTSELTTLLEHANSGYIKGIREELEKLTQLDAKYQPFVNQLQPLVKSFNIEKIRQFLQEKLEKN